jgi:hypothetical protein
MPPRRTAEADGDVAEGGSDVEGHMPFRRAEPDTDLQQGDDDVDGHRLR